MLAREILHQLIPHSHSSRCQAHCLVAGTRLDGTWGEAHLLLCGKLVTLSLTVTLP